MDVTDLSSSSKIDQYDVDDELSKPVNRNTLIEWNKTLTEYKAGKAHLDSRIIAAEQWWKLHNEYEELKEGIGWDPTFHPKSGWLHNVLTNKHADAMESYPEPVFLPREPGDKQEAKTLSSVIPVLLDENDFEETYSRAWWRKLKHGTGIYKITWDADKLNGLGDVAIADVDPLTIYWEPGIIDIEQSKMVFHVQLLDNDYLKSMYPQLKDKLGTSMFQNNRYIYDDNVSTDGKSAVIDVYYKKGVDGRMVLHYAKYVNNVVLYSTENGDNVQQQPAAAPAMTANDYIGMAQPAQQPVFGQEQTQDISDMPAEKETVSPIPEATGNTVGLYEDGEYPFVFDTLFPIEGSPCGYGYVDLCSNTQAQLDIMDRSLLKNFVAGTTPRYFYRNEGSINKEQFMDLNQSLVNFSGSITNDLQIIDYKPVASNYTTIYANKINELREISGNTQTATGSSTGGITSASGVAAMQEASGKLSRDAIRSSYRNYVKICKKVISRVRQFMDLPRQFRIVGQFGQHEFMSFSNEGLVPQWQGGIGTEDLGYRLPEFDIDVQAAKRNSYNRTAQNDLAIQLFQLGIFNPQYATQALSLVDIMDFDGKDDLMQKLQQNGTLFNQMQQLSQYVVQLLNKYEPENADAMAQSLGMNMQGLSAAGGGPALTTAKNGQTETGENPIVERARDKANGAAAV